MFPLQKVKVKRQWDHAFGEGKHRLEFAQHFFHHLFKDFPDFRKVFAKFRGDNIYSTEFQAAGQRLLNNIAMIIDTTDDPEANKVIIGKIKELHQAAGVPAEFYTAFRDEIIETVPEFLEGIHFDYDAWYGCFNLLIAGLK
jgi:hemoglobin-like flavoprotein